MGERKNMKHLKLLAGLMCLALVLSGCDDSDKKDDKNKASSDGLTYSSENVLDPNIIKSNLEVEVSQVDPTPEFAMLNNGTKIDQVNYVTNTNNLIVKVRNEEGYEGFYSKLHNDYIIAPYLVPNTYVLNSYSAGSVGYLLQLHYEDQYFIYDTLGNLLDTYDRPINSVYGTELVNEMYYLTYAYTDSKEMIFEYGSDGVAKEVSYIPDEIVIPEEEDVYEGPNLNTIFDYGAVELDGYGLPGYKMMTNGQGYITIFQNGSSISSFFVGNNGVNLVGIVNHSIYYQITTQLSERVDDFSFMIGNNKYFLETYKVDIETGSKEALSINAVFDVISPLMDSNKNVNVYLAFYRSITSVKTLSQMNQRLVDKEFVFHDDVSGVSFGTLRRIDENRYLDGNGVLYGQDLKPITFLTNLNGRTVYLNQKVIYGRVDGKYGLVDFNGKTVVEFLYDSIKVGYGKDGTYIAVKDNKAYRIHEGSHEAEYLGTNLQELSTNFFRATSLANQEYRYFTTSKNLFAVDSTMVLNINTMNILGNPVYSLFYTNLDVDLKNYLHFYVAAAETLKVPTITEEVAGKAVTSTMYEGTGNANALPVALGYNKIHINGNINARYVKFDVTDESSYGFFLDENITGVSVWRKKTELPGTSYNSVVTYLQDEFFSFEEADIQTSRYFLLQNAKDYTYVIELYSNMQVVNMVIDKVDGYFATTPVNGGLAGMNGPILFNTPKYLPETDTFYFNLRSIDTTTYQATLSSEDNLSLYRFYNLDTSSSLLNNGYVILNSNNPVEHFSIVTGQEVPANKAFSLNLEQVKDSYSEGQLATLPKAVALTDTDPITFTRKDNGVGFAKFTSTHGGRYTFKSTFSSLVTDFRLFSFDKEGKMIDESISTTANTVYSPLALLEEGGYVLIRFTYAADTIEFTPLVTGYAGSSLENPTALTLTSTGKASMGNASYEEYAYYTFTANTNGKFSIISNDSENFETYYKGGSEADFAAFKGYFSYSGTNEDPVTYVVKVVAKDYLSFYYSTEATDTTWDYSLDVGQSPLALTSVANGAVKKVVYTNDAERDVVLTMSSNYAVSVFVSVTGFSNTALTTKVSNLNEVIHLHSYENLYVTIVNNSGYTISKISLNAQDLGSPMNIYKHSPDSVIYNDWAVDNGVCTVTALDDNDVSEMYVFARVSGNISFQVKSGNHGTLRIYRQNLNSDGTSYGSRSLITSYSGTTAFSYHSLAVSYGTRIIFQYTEGTSLAKGYQPAVVRNITHYSGL